MVIAQGGEMGGWSLYVKNGAPRFAYNFLGREISRSLAPIACHPEKGDTPLRVCL